MSLELGLERSRLLIRAWDVLILVIAGAHVAVGAVMIWGGPTVFQNPVFSAFQTSPWWLWAYTAMFSGLFCFLPNGFHIVGLAGTALWFANWTALLIIGLIASDGPYTSVVIYLLLTGIHILVLVVEVLRWAWRDR